MKAMTHLKTTICLTSLLLAACGGGSSSQGTPSDPNDSTNQQDDDDSTNDTSDDDGTDDTSAPSVSISGEANVPGLASTATAEVDGDAEISWSITKQPDGSELDDTDLEDADQATVSFHPQIQGEYELTVTATAGGKSTTKSVSLDVQGYDVPFTVMTVQEVENEVVHELATHVAMMVNSGAGPAREVGCAHQVEAPDVGDAGSTFRRAFGTSVYMPRTQDGVARIVSRVYSDDPEVGGKIELAHSGSSCEDDPPALAELGPEIEEANFPFRFSPDGSRVAGIVAAEDEAMLLTVGNDGTEMHVLDSALVNWAPHYAWKGNEEVVILVRGEDEADPYRLIAAPDVNAPGDAPTILDCTGVDPEDAVLPSGQMFFGEDSWLIFGSPNTLVRLTPDDEGVYDCDRNSEQNQIISELAGPGDVSDDFSRVVFQSINDIYVVELDGSAEPQRISPDDGAQHFHPHFALGGQQIVWSSRYQPPVDDGMGGAPAVDPTVIRVFRANADGSHPFVIWQSEAPTEETLFATGGNQRGSNNCSFAVPLGVGSSGFLALGLAGVSLLRRRRRSR